MRKVIAVLLIAVGVYFIANNLWGQQSADGEQTTVDERFAFDASNINEIRITSDSMNVTVVKGKSNSEVVVELRSKSNKKRNFTAEVIDGKLDVKYKTQWTLFNFDFKSGTQLIVVEVPEKRWDQFEVNISSGNTKIEELNAESAKLEASSGNITVQKFKVEELTTRISSGNTKLLNGSGAVSSKTSSGNIEVDMLEIHHDIVLKSSSGNVELKAQQEPEHAEIELKTSSGRLSVDWNGLEKKDSNQQSFKGRIGSKDVKVELSTSSGNIKLSK